MRFTGSAGGATRREVLALFGAAATIGAGTIGLAGPAWAALDCATLAALRAGGLIVYFRHSLTIRAGQPDDDLSSCTNQRNLTEAGRELSRRIGAAFQTLRIPVGPVLASPYCRCVDTAALAFGRVEVAAYLETNGDADDAGERQRLARLAAVLAEPQPAGRNLILVAHGNNLQGLNMLHGYDLPGVAEAEAVVLRPRPGARAELLAAIKGEDWRAACA